MVDIHTHILPGMDDGASDLYDTLEMIRMAVDIGVTAMVATPHCNIPDVYCNYFDKEYVKVFQTVTDAVRKEGLAIRILPGMEAFGTYDLPQLITDGKIMPLNQGRYILVEFSFEEDPDFACDLLRRVSEVGAKPVVAHAERYEFVQDNPQIVYQWRRAGYAVQVNKGSFMGRFGDEARRTAYRMLSHNLISAVASDAHGCQRRTPYLLDAYESLTAERNPKYIDVLFKKNPERICANQPLVKLEPIPFSRYEL